MLDVGVVGNDPSAAVASSRFSFNLLPAPVVVADQDQVAQDSPHTREREGVRCAPMRADPTTGLWRNALSSHHCRRHGSPDANGLWRNALRAAVPDPRLRSLSDTFCQAECLFVRC